MIHRYDIQVVIGWQTRVTPVPGSAPRMTHGVGTHLRASNIILLDGVAYAELIAPDGRPEWGRLGEKGYVMFDDNEHLIFNNQIKHYAVPVKVEEVPPPTIDPALVKLDNIETLLEKVLNELKELRK